MFRVARNPGKLSGLEEAEEQSLAFWQRRAQRADDDSFKRGRIQSLGDLGIDFRHIERDHDRRAGILDLACNLALDLERIEIDNDSAGFQHREIGNDEIGRIGQTKADSHAVRDAETLETARGAIDLTRKFRVGQLTAEKIQRVVIGKRAGGVLQQGRDR